MLRPYEPTAVPVAVAVTPEPRSIVGYAVPFCQPFASAWLAITTTIAPSGVSTGVSVVSDSSGVSVGVSSLPVITSSIAKTAGNWLTPVFSALM